MRILDIQKILMAETVELGILAEIALDKRKNAQNLLKSYYKRQEKIKLQQEKQVELLKFEQSYYAQGYKYIAGVDEAGRGPIAGPLVVASVILPKGCNLLGVDDSKKLTAEKREFLCGEIYKQALAVNVQIISPQDVDRLNIYQATLKGMKDSLGELSIQPEVALIDAMPLTITGVLVKSIIKGDSLSLSIAAASIIAKTTRDKIMLQFHEVYPNYGLNRHKGYPTKEHIAAVEKYGVLDFYRQSYEPIKSMLAQKGGVVNANKC